MKYYSFHKSTIIQFIQKFINGDKQVVSEAYTSGELIWDLSSNESYLECLLENNIIDICLFLIKREIDNNNNNNNNSKDERIIEISFGILSNIFSISKSLCIEYHSNQDLVESILHQIYESKSSTSLSECFRLLHTIVYRKECVSFWLSISLDNDNQLLKRSLYLLDISLFDNLILNLIKYINIISFYSDEILKKDLIKYEITRIITDQLTRNDNYQDKFECILEIIVNLIDQEWCFNLKLYEAIYTVFQNYEHNTTILSLVISILSLSLNNDSINLFFKDNYNFKIINENTTMNNLNDSLDDILQILEYYLNNSNGGLESNKSEITLFLNDQLIKVKEKKEIEKDNDNDDQDKEIKIKYLLNKLNDID
ncbi:hypothetical protein CYY_000441 [Polysphondylium violaceum]|uniref:Uncharacterized protein n=1 Tax=Polysphondylium violaceum TaxID=133409 RepID=A0A8J4QAX4_9MYCE|nr:hypothetical protein CYY_000441 [Polysphondylium violaceum]